jgi:hypothetical protein
MVNARPLSLWAVERGEAAAASNKAGTSNGTSATGGWRYGTCLPVSSGEPIAKHNLPFRPPTTQLLPGKTPLPPLLERILALSSFGLQSSGFRSLYMESFVTLFLILSFLRRLFVAQLWLGLGGFRVPVLN